MRNSQSNPVQTPPRLANQGVTKESVPWASIYGTSGEKYGGFTDATGLFRPYGHVTSSNHTNQEVVVMQLYGILRRNGWRTPQDLEVAGKKSAEVGDEPGSGVRWIRSYALAEESGEVGTFCVYEGESPETIRAHAEASGIPCDEIIPILDTVVVRPDPVAAAS